MTVPTTSSALDEYRWRKEEARRAYARLNFREAVAATYPAFPFAAFALILGVLMALTVGYTAWDDLTQMAVNIFSSTALAAGLHKASAALANLPAFTPPLGVPLAAYYIFIALIFALWFAWMCISMKKAYFDDPKDERAAAHVEQQISFIFGAFIGGLLGHSIA